MPVRVQFSLHELFGTCSVFSLCACQMRRLEFRVHVVFTAHKVSSSVSRDTERNKDLAFLEAQIYEYVEVLGVRILFDL